MISIPERFLQINYNPEVKPQSNYSKDLIDGANCQIFVYSILRFYKHEIPEFRSSELWDDELFTCKVNEYQDFDILLYNNKDTAWGAHLALFIGNNKIIHLSKAIGKPEIIDCQKLQEREKYRYFIGVKRLKILNN